MSIQIQQITLYSKHGETHTIRFRLGQVNIITGASKSGKTAILDIIEYCLGRSSCPVSAGVIRQKVAWYSLVLQFADHQMFIARRTPSTTAGTSYEIYWEVAEQVSLPPLSKLHSITNPDGLVAELSRRLGIQPIQPQNLIPAASHQPHVANIKHAVFLCLQRQNVIAQPTFLFHRQPDKTSKNIEQTIKDTLPYFIGAYNENQLQNQNELRKLRGAVRAIERREKEKDTIAGDIVTRGRALVEEALQVGYPAPAGKVESAEEIQGYLRSVVTRIPVTDLLNFNERHTPNAEMRNLREIKNQLLQQQRSLLDELSRMDAYENQQDGYVGALREQRARLESIRLFQNQFTRHPNCPLCQQTLPENPPAVEAIMQASNKVTLNLERVRSLRPNLEKAREEIRTALENVRRDINFNREAMTAILEQDDISNAQVVLDARRLFVRGRVSLFLDSFKNPEAPVDSGIHDLEKMQDRMAELEQLINTDDARDRLESYNNQINRKMTEYSQHLTLEYSNRPLRLDLKKLTVVADTDLGAVPMHNMGSGENWVGYHMLAHLALHQWFVHKERPVPRFLVLDQPTQVYFPSEENYESANETDEDRVAVKQMFDLIFDFVAEMQGKFQVIILDHANEKKDARFQQAIVGVWRDGIKLVPERWPDKAPKN